MKILITGAGNVGFHLASTLSHDKDVTIIDKDPESCARLEGIDVKVLQGNAANAKLLIEAGIKKTDIVMAVTGNDEVNIITCIIANHLGVKNTCARVSNSDYIDRPMKHREQIGIGVMICPELVMAERIVTDLYFPSMVECHQQAGGKSEIVELKVSEGMPLIGPIEDFDLPENCNIVVIKRNGGIIMPSEINTIKPKDRLVLTCDVKSVSKLRRLIHEEATPQKVMIVGGGVVGFYLAKWLENMDFDLKLVEIDKQRCQALAKDLPETLILNGDGTDISLLEAENAGSMDVVFSVTGIDEKNLLCSLLAKQLGAKKIVSRVNRSDYINLFEIVGIDRAISPGMVMVETVIGMVTGEGDVVTIDRDEAELLELKVEKNSEIIGKNVTENMPKGAVLSMIMRDDQPIIPTSEFYVKEGDRVFVRVLPAISSRVKSLF
ncbi:MAG: Trk system potassium transporter TrkA [Methanotrichaceae archaeon]